jgi:hypothetical protein
MKLHQLELLELPSSYVFHNYHEKADSQVPGASFFKLLFLPTGKVCT